MLQIVGNNGSQSNGANCWEMSGVVGKSESIFCHKCSNLTVMRKLSLDSSGGGT